MTEQTAEKHISPSDDEVTKSFALQIADIVKDSDVSAEDRNTALAELLVALQQDHTADFAVGTAVHLLRDRRAAVRLCALEILRPLSGKNALADAIIWDQLLTDKTAAVLVPTYEMLRDHGQNATVDDLSGRRERREFPGIQAVDRVVKMSGAIPQYEYATRNRTQ